MTWKYFQVNIPGRSQLYATVRPNKHLLPASSLFLERKQGAAAGSGEAGQPRNRCGVLGYDSLFSGTKGHRWSQDGSTKITYTVTANGEMEWEAYWLEKEIKTLVLGYICPL